ncbi:cytochrome b [Polymorphum gilvum]|uniref:Cytochrome B561 n=1 Tax=Polymorphum gilvum (strain LMG 25793 / CGMCC 1.9160 / SL003B-26A1) TaxID=991905 RepID=F2J5H3_POLGS|nr:cytochrome b/b6 domain-containing protein [Polymorphum gilvum]ADZ72343.1 Cytochrome B561 [Polymorphum gilvum SL003B-26A1]
MVASAFRYDAVARLFHWVTVVLVLAMVPAGIAMTRIGPGSLQNTLFDFHRSVGVLLLVLTLLRLVWRLTRRPAPLPPSVPAVQRLAAAAVHGALYLILIFNPLLGWIATSAYGAPIPVFGLFTLPPLIAQDRPLSESLFAAHMALGILFTAAIIVHFAAAVYHGAVKRDGVMSRML